MEHMNEVRVLNMRPFLNLLKHGGILWSIIQVGQTQRGAAKTTTHAGIVISINRTFVTLALSGCFSLSNLSFVLT